MLDFRLPVDVGFLMSNYLVLFEGFCVNIFCDDFSFAVEMFLAVRCELLDFSLSLLSLFVKVLILSDADLKSFLLESEFGEKARFFGELMLMF